MARRKNAIVNSLCCILSPQVICKGCGKQWCNDCNPDSNLEWSDPERHKCMGRYWGCPSGKKVHVLPRKPDWDRSKDITYLEIYVE